MKKYIRPVFEVEAISSGAAVLSAPVSSFKDKYGLSSLSGIESYQYTSNQTIIGGDAIYDLNAD